MTLKVRSLGEDSNGRVLAETSFSDSFFKHASLGLNLCRMNGEWVESNPAFLKMIGYTREEAKNLTYWKLTPRKYDDMEAIQIRNLNHEGRYGPYDKEFIRKDGTLIPVKLNGFIVERDGEKLIWSIIEDQSLVQALGNRLETKVKQLEQQSLLLDSVLESIPTAIFLKDARDQFKVTYWNRAAERIFEIPRDEILGKTAHDLWPKSQADQYLAADQKVAREGIPVEIDEEPSQSRTRGTIYFRTKKIPLKLNDGSETHQLLCICEDITQDRIARIQLERARNELIQLTDNLSGPVSIVDSRGRYVFANSVYEKWFGHTVEFVVGRTHAEVLPPEVYSKAEPHLKKALAGIRTQEDFEIKTHKGEKLNVLANYIPRQDAQGVPDGFYVYVHDVSELKKANQELRGERHKLEGLMTGLGETVGVLATDAKGNIIFANRKLCEFSGFTSEELRGANVRVFNSGVHSKDFFKDLWSTVESGRPWHGEICNRKKDGSLYWIDTSILKTIDERGSVNYISVRINITDRKDAQARLMNAEKLATLGELSAGIAHEINNPLAIISASAQSIAKHSTDSAKVVSKVESIQKSCTRISKIVDGLRKFSRKDAGNEMSDKSFFAIAEEVLALTLHKANALKVPVLLDCKSKALIRCDEVRIEQVFVNLVSNALHAVKELSQKWVKLVVEDDDAKGELVVQVIDSGNGIPPEIQKKIFEPFFTTKPVGEGTGLGLSITRGILEEHHATLSIRNDLPNTCFEIRFKKTKS